MLARRRTNRGDGRASACQRRPTVGNRRVQLGAELCGEGFAALRAVHHLVNLRAEAGDLIEHRGVHIAPACEFCRVDKPAGGYACAGKLIHNPLPRGFGGLPRRTSLRRN